MRENNEENQNQGKVQHQNERTRLLPEGKLFTPNYIIVSKIKFMRNYYPGVKLCDLLTAMSEPKFRRMEKSNKKTLKTLKILIKCLAGFTNGQINLYLTISLDYWENYEIKL